MSKLQAVILVAFTIYFIFLVVFVSIEQALIAALAFAFGWGAGMLAGYITTTLIERRRERNGYYVESRDTY